MVANTIATSRYAIVFGAMRSQTGTSDNYWLFTGEQYDAETGFTCLRARYMNPALGRVVASGARVTTLRGLSFF